MDGNDEAITDSVCFNNDPIRYIICNRRKQPCSDSGHVYHYKQTYQILHIVMHEGV